MLKKRHSLGHLMTIGNVSLFTEGVRTTWKYKYYRYSTLLRQERNSEALAKSWRASHFQCQGTIN